MISLDSIENFNPKFSVVSCFIEHGHEILVLKRNSNKPQGESWGLPSGKIDENESEIEALQREVYEEIGFRIQAKDIKHGKKIYVRYPDYDFIFYTYSLPISDKIEIKLNPEEHTEYKWETKTKIKDLPLIPYFLESMELHYLK